MTINPFEPDGHTISPAAIVAARKARGYTQADLAYRLDREVPYTIDAIANWERGRNVPGERARRQLLKWFRETNKLIEKGVSE